MVSDNNLNKEYISISGKNPPNSLMNLEMNSATAILDIEKE